MVTSTKYGMGKTIPGTFTGALDRVKGAFQAEGFGVLTEIDLRKALDEKIGKKIEPYVIFGMCNPTFAARSLDEEHEIGLLLPCNVIVHECGGSVHVAVQDPDTLMAVAGNPNLLPIARQVKDKINKAMSLL